MKYKYSLPKQEMGNKPLLKLAETEILNVGGNCTWTMVNYIRRYVDSRHAVQNRPPSTIVIGVKLKF